MKVVYKRKVPGIGRIYFLASSAVPNHQYAGLSERTLSVAIFIHSSKFASIGTLFTGVTLLPVAKTSPSFSFPGVPGLPPAKDLRFRTGVAAALIWFICIS